jgi:hypothetical protein
MKRRFWTDDEWRKALDLNDARKTPLEMALALDRPVSSIHSRFTGQGVSFKAKGNTYRPKGWGNRQPQAYLDGKWTQEKWKRALALAQQGMDSETIAEQIGGVSAGDVRKRFTNFNKSALLIDVRQSRARLAEQERLDKAAQYLAARDERDARDLTGRFFGDPPPGYSALDRKRAQEARS